MDDRSTRNAFVAGVVAFSATTAFFISPILKFLDPDWLALFGALLGLGAAGILFAAAQGEAGGKLARQMYWFGAAGLLGLVWIVTGASVTVQENNERCAAIQRDMLSAKPRRSDGPELFQALGCVPLGSEDVHFPSAPPTS